MGPHKERVSQRIPVCTLGILLGAVVASYCPAVTSFLIYEREAVWCGQVWRLFSSHLVHFGGQHLAYDLLAFGVAGAMLEARGRRQLGTLCALTAVAIGGFLLIAKPEIVRYGGLSGVSTAVLTYVALSGLAEARRSRLICWAVLLMVLCKIVVEGVTGASILPYAIPAAFVPVWQAHAIGYAAGLCCFAGRARFAPGPCLAERRCGTGGGITEGLGRDLKPEGTGPSLSRPILSGPHNRSYSIMTPREVKGHPVHDARLGSFRDQVPVTIRRQSRHLRAGLGRQLMIENGFDIDMRV